MGRDPSALDQAVHLLERLLTTAREGGRTGSIIESLVLLALALQARTETSRAVETLEQALSLAEPQGYVRTFISEGSSIAPLIEAIARQGGPHSNYASSLLASLEPTESRRDFAVQSGTEALSDRELDVLRLLATDLDGPEIASELVVSLNTLRTHTRNIYGKLGVNSRRAAVTRAHDLRLIP